MPPDPNLAVSAVGSSCGGNVSTEPPRPRGLLHWHGCCSLTVVHVMGCKRSAHHRRCHKWRRIELCSSSRGWRVRRRRLVRRPGRSGGGKPVHRAASADYCRPVTLTETCQRILHRGRLLELEQPQEPDSQQGRVPQPRISLRRHTYTGSASANGCHVEESSPRSDRGDGASGDLKCSQ